MTRKGKGKEDYMAENAARKFFILVMNMRNAQKAFYAAGKESEDRKRWLAESKRLEKEVDSYIARFASIAIEQEGREKFSGLLGGEQK